MDTKSRAEPGEGSSKTAFDGLEAAQPGDGAATRVRTGEGSPETAFGGSEAPQPGEGSTTRTKARQAADSFAVPAAAPAEKSALKQHSTEKRSIA